MAHPPILALGYAEAAMLLRRPNAPNVEAIIAIHGPRESAVEAAVQHRLVLCFDDMEAVDPTDRMSVYRSHLRNRLAADNGLSPTPPTIDDARAIIVFADAIKDIEGVVLCHCGGGISRSPAAALLCLAVWLGAGREDQCVEELLHIRPSTVPHRDLVRFGDLLLGRGGRLSQAVAQRAECSGS